MKLGLILGEPVDAYHAAPAISHSKLHFFKGCFPADYHAKYIARTGAKEERKAHFDFGNAVEARCISHAEYMAQVAISPYDEFRTDVSKAWRNEQQAARRIVLKQAEARHVIKCYDAVMANKDARAIIENARAQVTFRERFSDVTLQSRVDFWAPNGVTLPSDGFETGPLDADLKTIDKIHDFQTQAIDFGYYHAQIFYREVIRLTLARMAGVPAESLPYVRRLFIVVDKTENPACTVYSLSEELVDIADREVIGSEYEPGLLLRLIRHYRENIWPGAPIRGEVAAPYWKRKKLND